MEIIIFLGVVIQLALLIYFFVKLNQIARSTSGDFLLNLYREFSQDKILRTISQRLKQQTEDNVILSLLSNNRQDFEYYLDFLEFVAYLRTGEKISFTQLSVLFGKDLDIIKFHQAELSEFLGDKRPHLKWIFIQTLQFAS